MALNKDKNLKLYFSISEVAQMFDVNESTLRFWEKEFDQIRPRKTGKGTRSYRQEDIDAIRLVYHLVKERGMTLAGGVYSSMYCIAKIGEKSGAGNPDT